MSTTAPQTGSGNLSAASAPFLSWLEDWVASLPAFNLEAYMQENVLDPDNVAVISADLVNGFCYEGPLASPRIRDIVAPSVEVFKLAHSLGVRNFVLVQEYHTHDAVEFEQYGPHCIRGTHEADTVDPLKELPFADLFKIVHKNSLHPALGTDLDAWLTDRPQINTFIAVGDCTDLCLYQLALHLKLSANARDSHVAVIVPANCADTFDMPIETARQIGTLPHDANLLHPLFLYHMAANGAQIVSRIV
ncbi:MAG: isochorismatase family protein [Chloroflexota bacterium]